MKKSALFLSAAITTFVIVIVAVVIFKARATAAAASVVPTAAPSTLAPTSTETATETLLPTDTSTLQPTSSIITPQEAVFIASSALGNTQVYSVDTVTRYGVDVYQVNFSSGHIVFVSPEGHILMITMLQAAGAPAATDQPADNSSSSPSKKPKGDSGDGGGDD